MYKMLVADDRPVIIKELSFIIKKALMDTDVQFVKSITKMNTMLDAEQYQMLILCQPSREPVPIRTIYNIVKRSKSIMLIILSEDIEPLPLKKIYKAGVHGILSKNTGHDEMQNAIGQVHAGNYLYNL